MALFNGKVRFDDTEINIRGDFLNPGKREADRPWRGIFETETDETLQAVRIAIHSDKEVSITFKKPDGEWTGVIKELDPIPLEIGNLQGFTMSNKPKWVETVSTGLLLEELPSGINFFDGSHLPVSSFSMPQDQSSFLFEAGWERNTEDYVRAVQAAESREKAVFKMDFYDFYAIGHLRNLHDQSKKESFWEFIEESQV